MLQTLKYMTIISAVPLKTLRSKFCLHAITSTGKGSLRSLRKTSAGEHTGRAGGENAGECREMGSDGERREVGGLRDESRQVQHREEIVRY